MLNVGRYRARESERERETDRDRDRDRDGLPDLLLLPRSAGPSGPAERGAGLAAVTEIRDGCPESL